MDELESSANEPEFSVGNEPEYSDNEMVKHYAKGYGAEDDSKGFLKQHPKACGAAGIVVLCGFAAGYKWYSRDPPFDFSSDGPLSDGSSAPNGSVDTFSSREVIPAP